MLKTFSDKKEYEISDVKAKIKSLKEKLAFLQQTVKNKQLPVIVVVEGWGASGKGNIVSEIISEMDPRSFKVFCDNENDDSANSRPFLWKYWNKIPEYGRFSIFIRSWYKEISTDVIEKDISQKKIKSRIESINTFEKQLSDDGYLIIKLFLNISQKEQEKRFKKLEESKNTSWRVTKTDKYRNKHYDKYYDAFDSMLEKTNSDFSQWNVIDSTESDFAVYNTLKIIIDSINNALQKQDNKIIENTSLKKNFDLKDVRKLSEVDLDKSISDDEYEKKLGKYQNELSKLQNTLFRKNIPVIIMFEGWDASGKGGAIKRIAKALDPRGYEAIPISAPNSYELAHHYLFRFWKNVPKTGHIAIFDRSWYGRVLVERVENLIKENVWERAYNEINEFEYELTKSGVIVIKFWLQIDKNEQLKRFNERQNTIEKQWKITDEDWRNREKWNSYEIAVNDMISKTSTEFSPWNIIEANDKKYARTKVLKTIIDIINEWVENQ